MEKSLPLIPAKRYFTIGEVAQLCGVKPHVLRYWEQEFAQLSPMKRRGNRRYYQHHEVLMIRRIRELLYEQGFTITGARQKLQEGSRGQALALTEINADAAPLTLISEEEKQAGLSTTLISTRLFLNEVSSDLQVVRQELLQIRDLLA